MGLEVTGSCMSGKDAVEWMENKCAPVILEQNDPELEEKFNKVLNRLRYEVKKTVPVPVKELRGRRVDHDCGNCGHVAFAGYEYCPNCGHRIDWKHPKVRKLR